MRRSLKDNSDKISIKLLLIRTAILLLLALLIGAVYFLPQLFISSRVADLYCRNAFPLLAFLPNSFNSLFLFSLTENIVVCGSLILIFLIIRKIVILINRLIKRGFVSFLSDFYKLLKNILIIALCMLIVFQMMHGINYRRPS